MPFLYSMKSLVTSKAKLTGLYRATASTIASSSFCGQVVSLTHGTLPLPPHLQMWLFAPRSSSSCPSQQMLGVAWGPLPLMPEWLGPSGFPIWLTGPSSQTLAPLGPPSLDWAGLSGHPAPFGTGTHSVTQNRLLGPHEPEMGDPPTHTPSHPKTHKTGLRSVHGRTRPGVHEQMRPSRWWEHEGTQQGLCVGEDFPFSQGRRHQEVRGESSH